MCVGGDWTVDDVLTCPSVEHIQEVNLLSEFLGWHPSFLASSLQSEAVPSYTSRMDPGRGASSPLHYHMNGGHIATHCCWQKLV